MLKVEEIKDKVQSSEAVLLYFKNDNCAPCHVLRPKIKELIDDHFPKFDMAFIDSVENPEFAGEFHVYANPTILVFFDGREYIRKSKYVAIPELKNEIDRLYGMKFN